MRAPRLPRFILLVGFGDMAYDSYLVAAFAVRGGLSGGEGSCYWFLWGRGLSLGLGARRVGALPSGVYPAGGLRWHGLWLPFAALGGGGVSGGGIWVDY